VGRVQKSFQMYQRTLSLLSTHKSQLPPEIEEGNIEYKLKLINPTPERLDQLTTQLKWRLAEGNGEAIYEIGVSDKGTLVGLNEKEMKESLDTLEQMGSTISAQFSILRKVKIKDNSVVEVLFRQSQDDQHFIEIRVAMLGGADAGKSTLLSVLCYGDKDDGEGTARLNLLRHRHEIETGRSSSLSRQIIGFTGSGKVINYATTNVSTWEQVCENANRIVTFMDTCGHPKVQFLNQYQKTTVGGLTGDSPDYACLVISASFGGLPDVSCEHFMLTKLLKVPFMIIITKIDIATSAQLSKTLEALMKLLKSPGISKIPVVIQHEDDLGASIPAITSKYFLI
jgi:GTPase